MSANILGMRINQSSSILCEAYSLFLSLFRLIQDDKDKVRKKKKTLAMMCLPSMRGHVTSSGEMRVLHAQGEEGDRIETKCLGDITNTKITHLSKHRYPHAQTL